MMRGVAVMMMMLLAFVAQANALELANHTKAMQDSKAEATFDRSVDKLVDRMIKAWFIHHSDVENTTLPITRREKLVKPKKCGSYEPTLPGLDPLQKSLEPTLPKYMDYVTELDRVKKEHENELDFAARKKGCLYVPPDHKLVFVMRIRGVKALRSNPKVRQYLKLLRLRRSNTGIFMRFDKQAVGMLRHLEPYIAYGYPSLESVRKLLYGRGFVNRNGVRVPLTDEVLEHLKPKGITCMEDMVQQIHSVGPLFKEATKYLWPFHLNNAKGGWTNKKHAFNEVQDENYYPHHTAGAFGNRQEFINDLINQII